MKSGQQVLRRLWSATGKLSIECTTGSFPHTNKGNYDRALVHAESIITSCMLLSKQVLIRVYIIARYLSVLIFYLKNGI